MGFIDKLSNLIFEDDQNAENESNKTSSKSERKKSWTDIFFVNTSEEDENKGKSFFDFLFEETDDDGIKSTFVEENKKTSILDNISFQIERRESELMNLADFFKAVNSTNYPDSGPEYEAYLSLAKQLKSIKELMTSSKNSEIDSMQNIQLESSFRKFELDYETHINIIQSLCYLNEISMLNKQMQELFSTRFTKQTEIKLKQMEEYITLISQKNNKFDKKYAARLYKELIEAEYRLTILKLMNELKNGNIPKQNPFATFSEQKKKTFETYLSKDIRDSNEKYNSIADSKDKYIKYNLVKEEYFDKLDSDVEIISERINKYTINNFLLDELFDNGDGFETLKRFLKFKLRLNYIDSKTKEADERFYDDNYR